VIRICDQWSTRTSTASFWASAPPLWAFTALHCPNLGLHRSWTMTLMRIRILLLTIMHSRSRSGSSFSLWCGSGSGFPNDANPDLASQMMQIHANPDPQHWFKPWTAPTPWLQLHCPLTMQVGKNNEVGIAFLCKQTQTATSARKRHSRYVSHTTLWNGKFKIIHLNLPARVYSSITYHIPCKPGFVPPSQSLVRTFFLKGLCHCNNKEVLSVHALIVFTAFCFSIKQSNSKF
jgi:hypothetical protein